MAAVHAAGPLPMIINFSAMFSLSRFGSNYYSAIGASANGRFGGPFCLRSPLDTIRKTNAKKFSHIPGPTARTTRRRIAGRHDGGTTGRSPAVRPLLLGLHAG